MKEMSLAPNEILFKANTLDSKLFFITEGSIEIYIEKSDKSKISVKNIEKGNVLGYENFFGNFAH